MGSVDHDVGRARVESQRRDLREGEPRLLRHPVVYEILKVQALMSLVSPSGLCPRRHLQ